MVLQRSVGGTRRTRINVEADGRKDDGATSSKGTRVRFLLTGQHDDNNEDEDEDDNYHDDDDDHDEDDEEEEAEEEEEEEEDRPLLRRSWRGNGTAKEVAEGELVAERDAATITVWPTVRGAERGGRWCPIASNRWHRLGPTWSDRYRHGGV